MGRLPAEVRAMTPEETIALLSGWNEAQAGDAVAPPTEDEYEDLVKRYG